VSRASPTPGAAWLRVATWPAADAAAWKGVCNPTPGPFSDNPPRTAATYDMYARGYGFYLAYLRSEGLLDPVETPAQRVTVDRLGGYYDHLVQRGIADYTIVGRFDALRGALRLLQPGEDFGFVTKPGFVSIRQMLPMNRRDRFVPDSRDAELWAETLFHVALDLADPAQRQKQVRDAALIGILASRAPRLRTIAGMRVGRHLYRVGDIWHLFFDASLMKGGKSLEVPLGARVGAIVERYLAVEREELLDGQGHDCVWVKVDGGPLSYRGIEFVVRARTKEHYGLAFGPHRFRTSLTTTQAVVDGKNLLGTSQILSHSPAVALKHYTRADGLEASRRHANYIDQAEDAAARMLKQR
jgi:site-specific recombinase XerC